MVWRRRPAIVQRVVSLTLRYWSFDAAVWLSPHTGWRRLETRQRLVDMTADNIASYVNATSESDIINVVN
jgi:lactate dehydrogenase-like 2-hydroxyacid dehydrogenase